jgi:hypothetical protein
MAVNPNPNKSSHTKLMHYGMMACCAVMLLSIAGYIVTGGTIEGWLSNSAIFLPLLFCLGAHVVMHKVMGKSYHQTPDDEKQTKAIPLLVDRRINKPQRQRL